ncbi:hypothetical protein ACIHEJ_19355 [Streptomyces sp. NPDC052301]|uniref:hypothetical protein n=1 Tax=Streptomyces sp. NPDC052301 TaxID=3365687 RepID=UPI0037D6EF55
MGDTFQTVVDLDATAAEAPRLATRVLDRLVTEGIVLAERADRTFGHHLPGPHWDRAVDPLDADRQPCDGLTVHIGRTVFHGGQDGPEWARCPRCTATTRLYTDDHDLIDASWEPYARAIGLWHTTGTADVTCPACAVPVPLPDWAWAHDHFAFAHLGFEFWNWPEFTDEFPALIAETLGGHRTVRVWGKF